MPVGGGKWEERKHEGERERRKRKQRDHNEKRECQTDIENAIPNMVLVVRVGDP